MKERPRDEYYGYLPGRTPVVFALAISLTFALWALQERSHRGRLRLETQITAEQASRRFSDWMVDRMSLSAFLAEKWETVYAAEPDRFRRDAARFTSGFPGFQAINWVDANKVIRIAVPLEGNESVLNFDLGTHPSRYVRDALDRALRERSLVRTPAFIDLLQGGKGFATYRPVFARDGEFLGFINSVFRVNELIDTCMGRMKVNQRFEFAIRESGGELIYPLGEASDYLLGSESAVEPVNVADQPWEFYLAPTAAYLHEQRYAVHHLIIPAGILVALLLAGFERGRAERKRALDASQEQFRDLFEQAPVAYFSVRADASIDRANKVAESLTGRASQEIQGADFFDLLPVDTSDRTRVRLRLDAARSGRSAREEEITFLRDDGTSIRAALYVDGVNDSRGAFSMFRIAAVDVTERYAAEEAQVRLLAAIDQAEEGVVITGRDGKIVYVNPAAGPALRYDTICQFLRENGVDSSTVAEVESAIESESSWRGSCLIKSENKDAAQFVATLSPVRDNQGRVMNFVFLQRDISEETRLQAQLQQSQKLEAVGRLAGGIAHDFNNILQSLLGYVTLARRNSNLSEEVAMCLEEIERASQRAANLVSHILSFGRQSRVDRRALPLRAVVEEVVTLVRASLPEAIRLTVVFGEVEHAVSADPTQIHQVLMNLVSNAIHALRNGGDLEIRYEAMEIAEGDAMYPAGLQPGLYMRLVVQDNGVGMDREVLARIFEPYFTTRDVGTGTGLGLATVHGIVENHHGVIAAESTPGVGSTFTVLLPAIMQETNSSEVQMTAPAEKSMLTDDGGEIDTKITILYVDDESQIVDSMRRILERLGFGVSGFTSSRAALEQFQKTPFQFDVLVTDLTMPDLNGIELAQAACTLRAELPIVFCSGYGETFENTLAEAPDPRRVFLKKPVSARLLADEIRRLVTLNASGEELSRGHEAP